MNTLRPKENIITVGGKTFNIVLTLSVVDRLQEKYDDLEKALAIVADLTKTTKSIAELATIFINDDIDCHNDDFPDKWEHVTSHWLQRRIVLNGEAPKDKILATDLLMAILNAFKIPTSEEEDDPNPQTTP